MWWFRFYLLGLLTLISGYTSLVGLEHGWSALALFFQPIAELTWQGQFNLDFLALLTVSGLWVMWRHQFRPLGILLGVSATCLGPLFLSLYLLVLSVTLGRDTLAIVLGRERANELRRAEP
jgi:hypothetical protein